MYRHHGAFAKYFVTNVDFVVHVPDNWSVYVTARLGITLFTAFPVLYDGLELLVPLGTYASCAQLPVLILGGATSVGCMRFKSRSSCACVSSPLSQQKFDLVRLLGTDAVVMLIRWLRPSKFGGRNERGAYS